jgi:hypothetical protein
MAWSASTLDAWAIERITVLSSQPYHSTTYDVRSKLSRLAKFDCLDSVDAIVLIERATTAPVGTAMRHWGWDCAHSLIVCAWVVWLFTSLAIH